VLPCELVTYPDLSLNSNGQLLVKPDRNGAAFLQQAENEVDWCQQCFAASHDECEGGWLESIRCRSNEEVKLCVP
jgi:hypothetical protein